MSLVVRRGVYGMLAKGFEHFSVNGCMIAANVAKISINSCLPQTMHLHRCSVGTPLDSHHEYCLQCLVDNPLLSL